ncbi:aspartate/glutamate racemase family protein [Reichenbachiella versicolor]|uniref:aspartate/glutamate racemase family protein n=1 Tax=Reichenbachiella versicolor TaxID=1821036 RepID=UPI000D6E40DE|nr:aspartate/glutamate racemase family protein [Reichenbachiella versicolor]
MKVLGLIGGISWVSTVDYYTQINKGINEKLGGLNYAECIVYSFNFQEIKNNNDTNDWDSTLEMVVSASKKLEQSGAKGIVLCANTMHFIADKIQERINIPLIHIATATALEVKKKGIKKVALLGTKFTMDYDFFKSKLSEQGIETIIPQNESDKEFVHDTIFNELGRGIITQETKARYLDIIGELKNSGAEGFIAGCTEIPLVVKESDLDIPYFDTAFIHAKAAVEFAVSEENK